MSSRIFQSIVLQMKDCSNRAVGVIDEQGTVVACNELTCIGEKWSNVATLLAAEQDTLVVSNGYTFKTLPGWNGQYDYAAFARGEDEQAALTCSMAVIALNGAKTYYEEKHDKATFVKNILSDNILLGDIYVRAKELHFVSEVPRAVILIRQIGVPDVSAIDVISGLYPDRQNDFVLSISETDVALVKQLTDNSDARDVQKIAQNLQDALSRELGMKTVIGVGTIVNHVRDLARAYKEAQVAIEVGKVFDTERSIINYENLGIGRLIYQLPPPCVKCSCRKCSKRTPSTRWITRLCSPSTSSLRTT